MRKQKIRSRDNLKPVKSHSGFKTFSKYIVVLLSFFLLIGLAYCFKIKNITCLVAGVADQEFCQQLFFLKNKSLFFTNFEQTPLFTSTLVNDQEQVFEPLELVKVLPDTVIINFKKEDPWYKLVINEQTFVVNSRGYLAPDSATFALPQVQLASDYQEQVKADKIDQDLHLLIYGLVHNFEQKSLAISNLTIDHDSSWMQLGKVKYLFEQDVSPALLAAQIKIIQDNLELVKQELNSESESLQVDLRFGLPVVSNN